MGASAANGQQPTTDPQLQLLSLATSPIGPILPPSSLQSITLNPPSQAPANDSQAPAPGFLPNGQPDPNYDPSKERQRPSQTQGGVSITVTPHDTVPGTGPAAPQDGNLLSIRTPPMGTSGDLAGRSPLIQLATDTSGLGPGVPADMNARWDKVWRFRQAESDNRNVRVEGYGQKRADGTVSHASGYYQMQPGTWQEGLKIAGLSPRWAEAIDAPGAVQDQVAMALYSKYGDKPWEASRTKGYGGGWGNPQLAYAKGFSGSATDMSTSLGQAPTSETVAQAGAPGQRNPLAIQGSAMGPDGMNLDMRKLVAMSMLRSLAKSGFGFQRVNYNPALVRAAGRESGIIKGMPRFGGLPNVVQREPLRTPLPEPAYSPSMMPHLGRELPRFRP